MKNNILINTTLVLLTTTILFGVGLSSNSTSATSASTALASVKVAASCTLTTSGGGNYSATVPNGTSAEIAGSTMSVSCNDAGGFALYAVGYSDDTIGNNNMIGSSTNIVTNTSGNDSYWAMKINPTSGTTPTIENSFNNYHIVPDIHTKVASYASSTGTGSLSVNATYKANISSTQLAGNYLGKVKYTLVHPANEVPPHEVACEVGKICYNANTNIVEGQMGKQTPTNTELTNGVTLWAPNFKRDGYGFAGWSDKYDYETNPDAHFYGPNQTITVPSDISTNGLPLYAIWAPSAGSMQSDAVTECDTLTQAPIDGTANFSSMSALTDDRDGDTYAIARLADGNCWMIENLRLDDSAILSSTNTNYPLLPLTNIYDLNTSSNHLSATSSVAYDATTAPEGWCRIESSECIDQSRLNTNNTTLFTNNTASSYSPNDNVYNYGNYYNWYSATAGHGKYSTSSSNYSVEGNICPSGWYLPKGGDKNNKTNSDYYILGVSLVGEEPLDYSQPFYSGTAASDAFRSFPANYVYAGGITNSTIVQRNSDAHYWTSTAWVVSSSFELNFWSESLSPGSSSQYKYRGYPIRCVAETDF